MCAVGTRSHGATAPSSAGALPVFVRSRRRAVVFGDAILGDQRGGLRLAPWFLEDEARERTRAALRALLDLPIEVVLPSHGNPVLADGKAALAQALDQ